MIKQLKYVIFIAACLSFTPNCWAQQKYEALKTGAGKYIDFLNFVGKSDEKTFSTKVPDIFASSVKKVINGKTMVPTREAVAPHLQKVRDKLGTWTIDNLGTVVSPEDHICVVRYVIKSSKKGNFLTIGILHYDDKGLITEINEVYHKFEG